MITSEKTGSYAGFYRRFVNILISIILIFITILVKNNVIDTGEWYNGIPFMLALFIYHISFLGRSKSYITDFRFWFLFLQYFFLFGIVGLFYFNLTKYVFWDVSSYFNSANLKVTFFYCLSCLQTIFTGFFWDSKNKRVLVAYRWNMKSLRNSSLFLLIVCTICRLVVDVFNIMAVRVTKNFNSVTSLNGIVDTLAIICVPALFLYVSTIRNNRRKISFFILAMIYFTAVMILSGDRRNPVIAVLVLFLYIIKTQKIKVNLKKIILFSIIVLFSLSILSAIRRIRNGDLMGLANFFVYLFKSIANNDSNIILDTLGEFGLTFFSCANIVSYMPLYFPFQFGYTFIRSTLTIFPIGWLIGDWLKNSTMSTIINNQTRLPLGASLVGDMYSNFGVWGSVGSGILMLILYRSMHLKKNADIAFQDAMYYSLFYIYLNLVRAAFVEVLRPTIWFLLFVFLFVKREKLN